MRNLQALSIEVCSRRLREFLRTSTRELKATQESSRFWRGCMYESLSLGRRKEYRSFGLIVVRQNLDAPGCRIANMSKTVCPIQTCGDGAHDSIDRSREPSRPEPIAPVQEIVFRRLLKLQSGERILVPLVLAIEGERGLELAFGFIGSLHAAMASQVTQVALERGDKRTSLDGANR
jgi:hypothetical protein